MLTILYRDKEKLSVTEGNGDGGGTTEEKDG